jgi:hypothetical protein
VRVVAVFSLKLKKVFGWIFDDSNGRMLYSPALPDVARSITCAAGRKPPKIMSGNMWRHKQTSSRRQTGELPSKFAIFLKPLLSNRYEEPGQNLVLLDYPSNSPKAKAARPSFEMHLPAVSLAL